jgi:hypothetical protein
MDIRKLLKKKLRCRNGNKNVTVSMNAVGNDLGDRNHKRKTEEEKTYSLKLFHFHFLLPRIQVYKVKSLSRKLYFA